MINKTKEVKSFRESGARCVWQTKCHRTEISLLVSPLWPLWPLTDHSSSHYTLITSWPPICVMLGHRDLMPHWTHMLPVTSQRGVPSLGSCATCERYNCVKTIIRPRIHQSQERAAALQVLTIITSNTSKCGPQSLLTGFNGVGNGWRISWNF